MTTGPASFKWTRDGIPWFVGKCRTWLRNRIYRRTQ